MARIIDAARGAPQWVSAPPLFALRLPGTSDVHQSAHPGRVPVHTPGSTWPAGQSIRRVVDEVDSIARQRLLPGEWRGVGNQDCEKSSDDHSRRRYDPERGA